MKERKQGERESEREEEREREGGGEREIREREQSERKRRKTPACYLFYASAYHQYNQPIVSLQPFVSSPLFSLLFDKHVYITIVVEKKARIHKSRSHNQTVKL